MACLQLCLAYHGSTHHPRFPGYIRPLMITLENSVFYTHGFIGYETIYSPVNKSVHNSAYGEVYLSIAAAVDHPVHITVRESTSQAIIDAVTDIIKSYGIKKYYDT